MTAGELMVAQRVEAREELAFDEIFESYQERIYNCIYRLVGNPEEAHDLTQETFLRAYASLPKIQGELKVGPWLYRIATNLCMDQLRRRKLIRWEPWDSFVSLFHPKQIALGGEVAPVPGSRGVSPGLPAAGWDGPAMSCDRRLLSFYRDGELTSEQK